MKLSIIIVNYNVKHFLEQCLHAVKKAARNIDTEIFVVDNNSVDGSAQLIREKFPGIHFIENKENVGFSKANNQAIKRSKGQYVLLLNPDTVVEEDTFEKVVSFMDTHHDAGGLGVKMINGKGTFLPESKRGLPTPWVAFYKVFGLSALFQNSKKFGRYHLSYLNEDEIHEVDVLAGAFMLLRKSALDRVGLLDENFFMYGEDIDLSYRLQLCGYKNYYYPETTIIHYKGESTKKGSLNYVKVFYNAMIIFVRKHFPGSNAGLFVLLIQLAIYFRALLSLFKRFIQKSILPLLDALLILCGFHFITPLWENFRFGKTDYYPNEFLMFVVPVYILFYVGGIYFSGGYKKPISLYRLSRGILWGLVSILLVYSLVDENYRFSRALILLGSAWAGFSLVTLRILFHRSKLKGFNLNISKKLKIAIVGHPKEAERVKHILEESQMQSQLAGFISLDQNDKGEDYIGELKQLPEIIRINRINEIIFCAENLRTADIIRTMLDLTSLDVDYKIAPPESLSIIGSNSTHTSGDLYVVNVNAISKKSNQRKKRLTDIQIAVFLLISCPITIWFYTFKGKFLSNIFKVLLGKRTWIGYYKENNTYENLPEIKDSILNPGDLFDDIDLERERIEQINMLYAKDYSPVKDAEILFKSFKKLDR